MLQNSVCRAVFAPGVAVWGWRTHVFREGFSRCKHKERGANSSATFPFLNAQGLLFTAAIKIRSHLPVAAVAAGTTFKPRWWMTETYLLPQWPHVQYLNHISG